MIAEAGLISLFRTILIIVGVYYAFKFIMRYLAPILLKNFIKKHQNQSNNFNADRRQEKEGSVHIKTTSSRREEKDKIGDYVDYEEVNEKDK